MKVQKTKVTSVAGGKPAKFEPVKELVAFITDDVVDRLWYEYFYPDPKPTPALQKHIMNEYNVAAKELNKLAGFERVSYISSSTKAPKYNIADEPPAISKPIFIGIKRFEGVTGIQHSPIGVSPKTSKLQSESVEMKIAKAAGKVKLPSAPKVAKSDLPGKGDSVIAKIINWHIAGKTKPEIIAMGFNRSTVARQVGEYIKGKGGKK